MNNRGPLRGRTWLLAYQAALVFEASSACLISMAHRIRQARLANWIASHEVSRASLLECEAIRVEPQMPAFLDLEEPLHRGRCAGPSI